MDNIRSDRWRPHQCFRALETPPGDVEALKWKKNCYTEIPSEAYTKPLYEKIYTPSTQFPAEWTSHVTELNPWPVATHF